MANDFMRSLDELNSLLLDTPLSELPIPPHMITSEMTEEDEQSLSGLATVRISDDKMQAYIKIKEPKDKTLRFSSYEIIQYLGAHNVLKGYHNSNIAAIAKKGVYNREILVARGEAPYEGRDGYYEFFFDTNSKKKPAIRDDGTVDYSAMSQLSNVNEGDVVAIYHHADQSRNGYDVTGKEQQIKPKKDLLPLKGRGVDNSENPDEYIATASGKIEYRDRHIDIKNVHEVRGDVDLITGKIEFFGDIHIIGNVEAGVVIRASRNVTVDGVVEAAEIYAGGDVVLKKGIQGGGKGKIVSQGSVFADFVEHCEVMAKGDIRSNSFVNSNVAAGDHVMAEGKKGIILGGRVHGLLGVSAQVVGNEVETKTLVESGYSAEDYVKYLEVFQEETDAQKALSDTVEQMTAILREKRLGSKTDDASTDKILLELNARKDEYFENLDKARTEKERLSEIIEKGKGSSITINDKIFMGATICVEGTVLQIPANTSYTRYRNEGGRIAASVISV